jgi:hypothetical protein
LETGKNDIGMVAWRLTLFTPEFAEGREIVVIANDITFDAGSFGTREDDFFHLCSKYAREVCACCVVFSISLFSFFSVLLLLVLFFSPASHPSYLYRGEQRSAYRLG